MIAVLHAPNAQGQQKLVPNVRLVLFCIQALVYPIVILATLQQQILMALVSHAQVHAVHVKVPKHIAYLVQIQKSYIQILVYRHAQKAIQTL